MWDAVDPADCSGLSTRENYQPGLYCTPCKFLCISVPLLENKELSLDQEGASNPILFLRRSDIVTNPLLSNASGKKTRPSKILTWRKRKKKGTPPTRHSG